MKIPHKSIVPVFLSFFTGLSSLQGATTLTAANIAAAATNPSLPDLGQDLITIGNFTISSTGTPTGNLGYGTANSQNYIGTVGNSSSLYFELGEQLTLGFTGTVSLVSLTLGGHGQNDQEAIISGFSSDPGASVTGLPAGWTVSFASGAVTIDSNNLAGFRGAYTVNFANTVNVTSLNLTAPNVGGGANGVGFVNITYVPEPSSALLGGIGLLCLLRRRR